MGQGDGDPFFRRNSHQNQPQNHLFILEKALNYEATVPTLGTRTQSQQPILSNRERLDCSELLQIKPALLAYDRLELLLNLIQRISLL